MGIKINIEAILAPVSVELPCGGSPADDISLFAQYSKIEKAATGVPEQMMGNSVIPAIGPDWARVCSLSDEYLRQCKDVRAAVLLVRGMLKLEGLKGLAEGVDLVAKLLHQYWPNLYPQLVDEDGGEEYELRVNAVAALASDMFLRDLHATPIVSSRVTGMFTYRDYRISKSNGGASSKDRFPDMAHIAGAFMEADPERLLMDRASIAAALVSMQAITVCFSELLPKAPAPDLSKLAQELSAIAAVYDGFMSQRGLGRSPMEASEEDAGQSAVVNAATGTMIGVEIQSREDVLRQIDKICQYYQKHEPSSPVPLVLGRAKRLVSMDFMGIMKDMCPDGILNVKQLAGMVDTEMTDGNRNNN